MRLTNAGKVLYPATGTTKAEVFAYYTDIAAVMLPHIAGRPATRLRWPDGVGAPSFFEKALAASAPGWLNRGTVVHQSGPTVYPIIDSVDALAWIAQQAALEVHVPQWRFTAEGTPGPPNRLVFDLDPGPGVSMAQLCEVAFAVRGLMDDMQLPLYPLTSGSKGVHLYAPIGGVSSDGAVVLARRVAEQLEQSMPELVTANMAKSRRTGRVFVDWSQNRAAKTTVAPYSLRGRDTPTVAAPRSWEEMTDPDIRQLRYDEVLDRVKRYGDLFSGLDADRLSTYRRKRNPARTPEPVPPVAPEPGSGRRFVIQEHHARRLHYDFRLEHDGVLVSWAVPKNLPESASVNRLAVRTEDHPVEYATFEGVIPRGEYGAGTVSIWDSGTYRAEKFDLAGGEVIAELDGKRISGRYALIKTGGDQWLAHRMKDQSRPEVRDLAPMLATLRAVDTLRAGQYAFEGKYDGYRMLVAADHGRLRLQSRNGRDVTDEFPQLRPLGELLAEHRVILDGEVVALDSRGEPSFAALQNRAGLNRTRDARIQFWAFDILHLDGRSLLRVKYRDRRHLLETLSAGTGLIVPALLDGDGAQALAHSRKRGWEGVVAKKWDSIYQPGRRSSAWIKDKNWNTQEVVIGGWRAGEGGHSGGIGSLLLGIPHGGALRFIGRVGTGFSDKERAGLATALASLRSDESPFDPPLSRRDAIGVTYVRPELVGEVRYGELTQDGRLRHPSWRGLRGDKAPDQVVLEEPVSSRSRSRTASRSTPRRGRTAE